MRHAVVVPAVQVAVNPQIGVRQQIVIGVAKTGRARLFAVARIGAAKAWSKVGNRYGVVPVAPGQGQFSGQPGPARQLLGAHADGVERHAVARRAHDVHEVAGCTHRALALCCAE